jgi:hypothetical protein
MTLQRPNETPDAVLRRLERRPDYHRLIATDEGQRLLEAAAKQAKAARVRVECVQCGAAKRGGGHWWPTGAWSCTACFHADFG